MQKLRYSRYFKTAVILLDIAVVAAVLLFFYLRKNPVLDLVTQEKNLISVILLVVFWLLLSNKTQIYYVPRNTTYTIYLQKVFAQIFIFSAVFLLFSRILENDVLKEERSIIVAILFFLLLFLKSLIFFFLKYIRSKGLNVRNIMFLSQDSSVDVLKAIISERKDYGYKIFDYQLDKIDVDELKEFWIKNGIHTIFISSQNHLPSSLETKIFEEAEAHKVKISLIPNSIQNEFFSYNLSYIQSQPILLPIKFPLESYTNSILKRIFDIIFSVLVLVGVGIWLFPILALLIKIDSKGPVFFIQKRYGFHDKVFNCFKFRTMYVNVDSATKTTAMNDRRITKIGTILRKTSLDEMPQFFNVLLGDMSVVGPRPHMILVDNLYKPKIRRYALRSLVKPGITGLAQVNGLRGDKGNMDLEMKRRVLADSFYVKNWSFMLDMVIIFKTLVLLVEGDKNAH